MVNKKYIGDIVANLLPQYKKDNQDNTINTICTFSNKSFKLRNTNSIDNIVYTNNIKFTTTCGSGKKFKQCCLRKYKVYEVLGRIFDLNIETNKHWKEFCEKGKKEAKLKIENIEKVTE